MAVSKQDQKINRVRAEVRETISIIGQGPQANEVADEKSSMALREISALRVELDDEKAFHAAMMRVGFDRSGIEMIIKGLDGQRGFQKSALAAIAKVPFPDITTERLNLAMARHIATPECRRDLTRAVRPPLGPDDVDSSHEFAPFLLRVFNGDVFPKVRAEMLARMTTYIRSGHAAKDFTDPDSADPTALAMHLLVKRLRENEDVSAVEVEQVISSRFSDLFVPIKILRNQECEEGGILPLAFPAEASDFSSLPTTHQKKGQAGSVEGSGRMDAVIRDATNKSRWHLAAATSNENTESQGDQLARHHAAIRNSIEMGIPPFNKADHIATLLFFSPSLMIQSRIDRIEESGPALSQPEIAALNALALYSQMAHTPQQMQMELASVLSFEHLATGGVSAAIGGIGRSESQLVSLATAQFSRAVRALGNPKRHLDFESHGSGSLLTLMEMIRQTGTALISSFAADAENGLRQAAPALRHLGEQAIKQGVRVMGHELTSLADQIEAIGPVARERNQAGVRRKPAETDRPTLMATYFNTLSRRQQFLSLKEQNDWSAATHARWEEASKKGSNRVWSALIEGSVDIRDLAANRSGENQHVLDLSPHQQGAWAKGFPAKKIKLDTEGNQGARFFSREKEAQVFREQTVLSKQEASDLAQIQRYASPSLWQSVLNQSVPITEVIESTGHRSVAILDMNDVTQDRWVKERMGVVEMTPLAKKLLREPAVSEQHADFIDRARPAMEQALISETTIYFFDSVARQGSVRVYEQVMMGRLSPHNLYFGKTASGEPILKQPKSVQNEWLRENMARRVRFVPAPASVVIESARLEAQAAQARRRPKRQTR